MPKITAKGKFRGGVMTVEVIDSETYINGEEDDGLDYILHEQRPIGGTYYAASESMENILHNLTKYFFDNDPIIEVDGEIEEIPSVEGRIY